MIATDFYLILLDVQICFSFNDIQLFFQIILLFVLSFFVRDNFWFLSSCFIIPKQRKKICHLIRTSEAIKQFLEIFFCDSNFRVFSLRCNLQNEICSQHLCPVIKTILIIVNYSSHNIVVFLKRCFDAREHECSTFSSF